MENRTIRWILGWGILGFLLGLGMTNGWAAKKAPTSRKAQVKTTKKKSAKKTSSTSKGLAKRRKQHRWMLSLMKSEMTRYMKVFKGFRLPKVYYMRYRLRFKRAIFLSAMDGTLAYQSDTRKNTRCYLNVQLRVGNHTFDNTGPDGYDWKIYKSLLPTTTYCPQELSGHVLKDMLWRNTDRAYRIAVGQYWRKRFVRSTRPKLRDKAGDFSKEPPLVYMASLEPRVTFNKKRWSKILKRVSKLVRRIPRVVRSGIGLRAFENVVLGVASDGSLVRQRRFGYEWSITMSYLGKNKEYISGTVNGYVRLESELPTEAKLLKKMKALLLSLKRRVNAEEGEPSAGPAIVDPYLAGAMFYDILMSRLGSGRFLKKYDSRVFAKKIGKQIIPSFLTIIDDPTRTYWKKTPLSSHYLYDDQWVRARRMVMVDKGVLKHFYMSRKPYKKHKRSNGHGRAFFGRDGFSRPGSTFVQSQKSFPLSVLTQKLRAELKRSGKRFGYVVKGFQGNSQVRRGVYNVHPADVYRLDNKTGKLTQLKGLTIRMSALQILSGIMATGNDHMVFNGSDYEFSGTISLSMVSPSLLLKRLVFTRRQSRDRKLFELPPPFKTQSFKDLKISSSKSKASVCPAKCPEVCRKCSVCRKN